MFPEAEIKQPQAKCYSTQRNSARPAIPMSGKDGDGSSSGRVEYLGTQNRNLNLKLKPKPNTDSCENPSPKSNPRILEIRLDTRNPFYKAIVVRAVSTCYKQMHNIYNIHTRQ